ncbi:MAG: DNA replication and repair protein RecF, partial [Rhodothermaceae bacterium]|nr:DNA replication and repair protein RecF [Rhodothermaceae bacterium]
MHLRHLRLLSFRAHAETTLDLAPKVNLLVGPNGAGKTNVLEAVHYLCLTKSFLTSTDAHAVRRGCPFFEIEGTFEGERRAAVTAKLVYVPSEGKRLFLNGAPLNRLAEIVGELPIVVLSPADYALTAGGPEERRRFLDATLSQAHPVYLDDLLKYRRALKQRNALLQQIRRGRRLAPGTLDAWDTELVALGTRIIDRRRRFLSRFAEFLAEAYRLLDAVGEEPTMTYQTVAPVEDEPEAELLAERFRARLDRVERREAERGRTLVGPHLDEVVFRLGDFEVRPYASQGQH